MARVFGTFEATLREIAEGEEEVQFEFCGERFTIAPYLGAAPMMKFAAALETSFGMDSRFMAAMNALLRDCLKDDAEYQRFMQVAAANKVTGDDIFEVCKGVWIELTTRPTTRPADSSDGPPQTSTSTSASSTKPASSRRSRKTRTGTG